jgi:hypothetical protein
MNRTEQRLSKLVDARLEPGESFVAWSRAWVSRHGRFHWLLAARNRDFAVVTDRRLMLWSAGFFTRSPRRRVLAERLDELVIESIGHDPGRRLACRKPGRRALLLELGKGSRPDLFSIHLRDGVADARRRAGFAPVPDVAASAAATAPAPAPPPEPAGEMPPGAEPWAS